MTLSIGSTAPNFTAETTQGPLNFHDYIDGGYGILREYQRDAYGETFACDLEQPDFPELARSFGVPVEQTTPDVLTGALERAFATAGPAVVHLPARLEMWTPTT